VTDLGADVATGRAAALGELPTGAGYAAMAEAGDPYCLGPGEAARLLAGHPWRRFAVIGDSVASGVGDPVDGYVRMPWCDRIAAELRATAPDFAYLNLGARETLAAGAREEQLPPALAFRPDLTLVAAGGNDALRKTYQPEVVDADLAAVIGALRDAGSDVITVGMFDVSYAPSIPDRIRELVSERMTLLSARTAALADRYGCLHVTVTGHPVQPDATMYSADGLHGNLRSHAVCAAEAVRRLGIHIGTADASVLWPVRLAA
jgi:lysophospholipase L1-like esterase